MEDTIALAARAHRGQRYPSPERESYIFHPLRVMLSLGEPADQIVAVLHDVVEDTDVGLRHLVRAGYPPEIVAAVDASAIAPTNPTTSTSSVWLRTKSHAA